MTITCVAIFQYDDDGICVSFPDFPVCNTCGYSFIEAVNMAKEVLALGLHGMPVRDEATFLKLSDAILLPNQEAIIISIDLENRNGLYFSPKAIPL